MRRYVFIATAGLGLAAVVGLGGLGIAAQQRSGDAFSETVSAQAQNILIAAGFGIDQVTLTGQRHASDTEIFDALDLGNVRAFWQLDAAAALKRIERVAWVDTAQITRVYPSRLNIEVKERAASAVWTRGDSVFLIDATGRVLSQVRPEDAPRLPRIAGAGANEEAGRVLAALARHPEIASAVSYCERVNERRWRLAMKNGARVELAAEREVEGLDQIAENAMLRKALGGSPVVIDLRTAARVAIRPGGEKADRLAEARSP